MPTFDQAGKVRNASIGDCARLWSTLTTDYIPELKLELEVCHEPNGRPFLRVMVCDYSTVANLPRGPRSVWGVREFRSELYLITVSQLFDLLIDSYNVLDEYFATGVDKRPCPSKG